MPRPRLLTAICLCALGWAAPAAQATPTWLPALTVSNPLTAAPAGIEPVVSMGPGGDIAAAWWEGEDIVAGVRQVGATAFTLQTVSAPADKSAHPSIAVNASGAVVVAWTDETTQQYEVAIRPPGGTFSAPIEAAPTGGGIGQTASVAIDDAGDVLLVGSHYSGGLGGHYEAFYAWQPAGETFAVTALSAPASEAGTPVVAMDGAGDAVIAWEDNTGTAHTIARAVTRPAGGTFGSTQSLTNGSEYAFALTVAIGSGGQAAIAWQSGTTAPPYRIEASTSAGPTDLLTLPQTISPAGGDDEYPAIGVAGNGETVAAWEQYGPTTGEGAASATAGGSFATPTTLGEEAGAGDPQVAANGAGDALITWGADPLGGSESVQAVIRTADGSFSPEQVLSESGEKIDWGIYGNLPAASAGIDNGGDAIVGWERGSDHTVQARIYEVGKSTTAPVVPTDVLYEHGPVRTGPRTKQCVVPRLKGLSPAAAKRRLQHAGCKLGKTSVAHRYRHAKRLVVSAQGVKAGTALALDAKVAVTLKPPAPPRHKHRHR
jgi:hypothetical protein